MFATINVKNGSEHNLHMKQKHDVAIKSMPTILGSVKKVRVFRWLEEMHLSETALLIRLSGVCARFWAAGFMGNIDSLEHIPEFGEENCDGEDGNMALIAALD